MGKPCIGSRFCCRAQVGHSIVDVGGIPEQDRGDDEVKPGGTKLLRLGAAVGDPALLESADDLRERMTLLALVKSGMAAPAQFWAFEPVEREQRAFDRPQLLQRQVELVLAGDRPRVSGAWRMAPRCRPSVPRPGELSRPNAPG